MREVVLKLTSQKDVIKHESDATTFGELKKEMRQVKWSGMRVVERSTKTTLQMDEAILPQGDFLLFLVPEKVKSGRKTSGGTEELGQPIEECSYNVCRSHMSWLNRNKDANLDMSGGTDDLRLQLMEYYEKNPKGAPKAAAKKTASKPAAKAPVAKKAAAKPAAQKAAPKEEVKEEETKKERKARVKAEKKAAKVQAAAPTDPIDIIETARNNINKAVDELVQKHISGAQIIAPGGPLEYTLKGLDAELKEVHRALRTSRSSAKYID